jgi:hypothetical protein
MGKNSYSTKTVLVSAVICTQDFASTSRFNYCTTLLRMRESEFPLMFFSEKPQKDPSRQFQFDTEKI